MRARIALPLAALFLGLIIPACALDSTESVGEAEQALYMSGSTANYGYYTYPARTFTLAPNTGCSFGTGQISVQALDVPNRFTVKDANGNYVTGSQWLGNATYPGPWGSSLSTSNPSSATLTISQAGTYSLIVETSAQQYGTTDAWSATSTNTSINCTTSGSSSSSSSSGGTCSCGLSGTSSFSGSRAAGLGYYTYPDQSFSVACCSANRTITLSVSALDVPNRFTVYDSSGTYRAGTGWLGSTTQAGPWGSSLSNSGSATISFSGGNGTYKLRVETSTTDQSDYWSAYVY